MTLTIKVALTRPYRFLIDTPSLGVALLATDEAFFGHPWVFMRHRGVHRRYIAAIPLTRRTHLFIGVAL